MPSDINQLYRLAADPGTAPRVLADLAARNDLLWPTIAANPACYDELREWIERQELTRPLTRPQSGKRQHGANVSLPSPSELPPPPPVPAPAKRNIPQAIVGWSIGVLGVGLIMALLALTGFQAVRAAMSNGPVAAVSVSELSSEPVPLEPWEHPLATITDPTQQACLDLTTGTIGQDRAVVVEGVRVQQAGCEAARLSGSTTALGSPDAASSEDRAESSAAAASPATLVTLVNTRNGATSWTTDLSEQAAWVAGSTVRNVTPIGGSEVVLQISNERDGFTSIVTLNQQSGLLSDEAQQLAPSPNLTYSSATIADIPSDPDGFLIIGQRVGTSASEVSYVRSSQPTQPVWSYQYSSVLQPSATFVDDVVLLAPDVADDPATPMPEEATPVVVNLNDGSVVTDHEFTSVKVTRVGSSFITYAPNPADAAHSGTISGINNRGETQWQRPGVSEPQFSAAGASNEDLTFDAHGSVYVRAGDNHALLRIDPETGTDFWSEPLAVDGSVWSGPYGSGDSLILTGTDGAAVDQLTVVDVATGNVDYTRGAPGSSITLLGLSATVGYTTSTAADGTMVLTAFDTATNATLWSKAGTPGATFSLLGGQLVRFDPATSTLAQLSGN
ncbi:PQQ-like beta-propeller repeat protein [Lysinibacter cavernae]|uniref:Leucine rich repeat variant domain-containing protein n=1 Tax=Lysinibacter cavernae TaxID=1640652 RepID=A0A7X5TTT2_9MICO|nr:PQQ-like beta-propeller repeat protein [Lysinibacter cavernae]NIH53618.1 hypothetical protein [Lysinibacter cavernae]